MAGSERKKRDICAQLERWAILLIPSTEKLLHNEILEKNCLGGCLRE